ncbi:MAG TPA: methylated-DNA--[protein]-cysteine S-methyltransferase, partial [Halococcus sp.]|nr:methylated-DNA--[protein]-cysteine S-methyltransferase [Halococcus sp.]
MSEVAGIYARESAYLDRCVQVGVASERVISVSFPATPGDADPDHSLLDRIFDYLEGSHDEFADVEVALTVPTDQRAVLEAVREIPYGNQVSVSRLTGHVAGFDADEDTDRDRVRTALDENPLPLLIP